MASQTSPARLAKPARRKLDDALRERIAARLLNGEPQQAIVDAINTVSTDKISVQIVKTVQAELDAGLANADTEGFSPSRQLQFDRAIRAARIIIRAELEAEVRTEVHRHFDRHYLPAIQAKLDKANRILAAHKGAISRDTFRRISACLHPDSADEDRKPRFAEAFASFRALENILVKTEEKPLPGMPTSAAELLRRRR